MNLSAPTHIVFFIAVILAILSAAVYYFNIAIPVLSAHVFEGLLLAFVILVAGNLFKGA